MRPPSPGDACTGQWERTQARRGCTAQWEGEDTGRAGVGRGSGCRGEPGEASGWAETERALPAAGDPGGRLYTGWAFVGTTLPGVELSSGSEGQARLVPGRAGPGGKCPRRPLPHTWACKARAGVARRCEAEGRRLPTASYSARVKRGASCSCLGRWKERRVARRLRGEAGLCWPEDRGRGLEEAGPQGAGPQGQGLEGAGPAGGPRGAGASRAGPPRDGGLGGEASRAGPRGRGLSGAGPRGAGRLEGRASRAGPRGAGPQLGGGASEGRGLEGRGLEGPAPGATNARVWKSF